MAGARLDPGTRRLVWLMVAGMLFSFTFGIAMFLPAENRASMLEETMRRYQARNPDASQTQPTANKRIRVE